MGNKIKPNWGRDAGWGVFLPELSDRFRHDVRRILAITDEPLDNYLAGLKNNIDIYVCRKDEADRRRNTDGQLKQAAIDIKKVTQTLSEMLCGDAGGMQPYIDYSVSLPLRGNGNMIFMEEFTQLLHGVENGCDHFLNDIYPELGKDKTPRLKELFARDVMVHYSASLNEQPKTTLSLDDENRISKYARILKACFLEVDNDIPSDGDLKKIMSWALNNRTE